MMSMRANCGCGQRVRFGVCLLVWMSLIGPNPGQAWAAGPESVHDLTLKLPGEAAARADPCRRTDEGLS